MREPIHRRLEARHSFVPVAGKIERQDAIRNRVGFQALPFANLPDTKQDRIHRCQAFFRRRHNSFKAPSRLVAAEDASLIISVRLASALSTESQWIFHSASSTFPSGDAGTQASVLPLMLSRVIPHSLAPVKRPLSYWTLPILSLT